MREGGALVDQEKERKKAKSKPTRAELAQLFTSRNLWVVYLGQYCITALTYFFITWFPIYLIKGRGMTIMEAGWVAALPAICGFTGGILGGFVSDCLIRRGVHPSRARKTPFVIGMALSTSLVLANYVDGNAAVIALMTLAFFGKGLAAVGWCPAETHPNEKQKRQTARWRDRISHSRHLAFMEMRCRDRTVPRRSRVISHSLAGLK